MTLCVRMSSTKHPYDSQPLGWQIHEASVKVLKGFDLRLGDMYVWVGEVIAEAKKTLAVEDIKLLPKTPSAKSRTRRCQRALRSNAVCNNEAADISMEILPAKKTGGKNLQTKKESQREAIEEAKLVEVAVASEPRCTRSKMRDLQAVSVVSAVATPPNSGNGVSTFDTPSTATRSKGNKIKQLQELLCKDPGFGLKPAQTAANADDDDQPSSTKRRSSKRQKEAGSVESRAKRQCNEEDKISPDKATASASGPIQDLKNNVKDTYVSSCYPVLKKAPTPNSQSTVSFLQRNTPTVLNRQEVGRKKLTAKVKKMEEMTQKKNEELQKKAEEQKRLREEHYNSVLKRRQELEQSTVKKGPSKLDETSSAIKTNDREKSKIGTLRERRLAEAEQRRRQEEEAKKQALLQQEKEKQILEEQQRRHKEQQEQERQQRIVKQRHQEEERRLRHERERQEEQERLRKLELQRLKEEEEKRKQKEESTLRERRLAEAEQRRRQEEEAKKQALLQQEKEKQILEEQQRHHKEQQEQERQQRIVKQRHQEEERRLRHERECQEEQERLRKLELQRLKEEEEKQKQEEESYEMTPRIKKLKTTSTDSNYNIDDLHSEDSTDDESQPRKKIPLWAQGNQLKIALISQISNPPDVDHLFGHIASPDLNMVFTKKRARFNKRTSSANWDEPVLPKKTNTH